MTEKEIEKAIKPFYKNYEEIKKHCNWGLNPADDSIYLNLIELLHNNEKLIAVNCLYDFYTKYKFYDYHSIITLIKEAGFKEELLLPTDFINLKELEDIALKIYQSGYPFSFKMLFDYSTTQIQTNVLRRIQLRYYSNIEKIEYEKDRLLTPMQIEIENAQRRIKYKKKIKPLDEFAADTEQLDNAFKKLFKSVDEDVAKKYRFSTEMKRYLNDIQLSMKWIGKGFFEGVEEFCKIVEMPKNRRQILTAFEPVFRIVFESKKRGLYTREDFDNLKEYNYDGYYYKYYLSRLKVLTGY